MTQDLIFISIEPWDDVWRRNQFVTERLARRHPDRKILWVNPPADVSNSIRRGRVGKALRGLLPPSPQPMPGLPNLFLFTPTKLFPNTWSVGSRANEAMSRAQIQRAAGQVGITPGLLWINPYYAAHMAGRMGELSLLYDLGEDWSAMPLPEAVKRRIIAEDHDLTVKADAVVVCCRQLVDLKHEFADKVHLIPNGVDVDRYREVCHRTLPPHPLARDWAHPILAHTGTIHSDRTDVDLVIATAEAFAEGTLALIGPNHLTETDRQRLAQLPNVRVTGPVKNSELPRLMSAFDVCLVPHKVDAFSESQNPLKLWEYLASGLPIASTPINGFRDFPQVVHLGNGPEGFINAVRTALVESPELCARRQGIVASQTWDACVDRIEEVMDAISKTKQPALAA